MALVLTHAHLIDCVHPSPMADVSVTVQDGRIAKITEGPHSPGTPDDEVIDLQGAYLLPGLWDVHVHLEWPRRPDAKLAELTVQYGTNATQGLTQSGITGIRTAGTPHFIDVALKRAYDSGQLIGPRIFAGGYFLTTTAGHALASGFAKECDGPSGFTQAIREQMQNGVDHIKLNLTGGIMGPFWDRHWHSFLLPEELDAAFRICRQRGYPVMAHAANPDSVKAALRLGAHTVEHGYIMDDECLDLFLEHDAWYIPTLGITHLTPNQADSSWECCWLDRRGLPPRFGPACGRRRGRASHVVPAGLASGSQNGARLRSPTATRCSVARNGTVGQRWRYHLANPACRHQIRRRSLRRGR